MNHNLRKIIEESGIHEDVCSSCPIQNIHEFAKKVIDQCVHIAELKEQGYSDYHPDISVGWYIKKHFGMD